MADKVECICSQFDEISGFHSIYEFERFQKYLDGLVKTADVKEVPVQKYYAGFQEKWFIFLGTTTEKANMVILQSAIPIAPSEATKLHRLQLTLPCDNKQNASNSSSTFRGCCYFRHMASVSGNSSIRPDIVPSMGRK